MSKIKWRPIEMSDAATITAMHAAEKQQNPRIPFASQTTIEHTLHLILDNPQAAGTVLLNESDQVIGTALVIHRPGDDEVTAHFVGHVHIDHRRKRLGEQLFEWAENESKSIYRKSETDKPLNFRASCRDFMTDRIALFESKGMAPVRYSIEMRCELDQVKSNYSLPSNMEIVNWSDDQDDALRQAFNLAFKEHWGVRELDAEDWRKRFIETPYFRPDLTYLVYADDQLVGFCLAECHVDSNEQSGREEVYIEIIGVHPEWRGRRIASGLMTYAMAYYRAQGFTHASLNVDADNGTNAIALYQKLGFIEVRREIIFGKSIM